MTKIVIPPGLIRSKVYRFECKAEASFLLRPDNEDEVIRVRMANGHWLPLDTWRRRVEALGLQIEEEWRTFGAGTHAVGS